MTDIEQKALALLNVVAGTERYVDLYEEINEHYMKEALCRAIEQHKAFRQEVSDAVVSYFQPYDSPIGFQRFIIHEPKPDPLVEAMADCGVDRFESWADQLRAALEARGLEIREKGQ